MHSKPFRSGYDCVECQRVQKKTQPLTKSLEKKKVLGLTKETRNNIRIINGIQRKARTDTNYTLPRCAYVYAAKVNGKNEMQTKSTRRRNDKIYGNEMVKPIYLMAFLIPLARVVAVLQPVYFCFVDFFPSTGISCVRTFQLSTLICARCKMRM